MFLGGLGIDSCLVRKGSAGSVLRPLFTMLLCAVANTFSFSGLLLSAAATHAGGGGPATAAVAGHVYR